MSAPTAAKCFNSLCSFVIDLDQYDFSEIIDLFNKHFNSLKNVAAAPSDEEMKSPLYHFVSLMDRVGMMVNFFKNIIEECNKCRGCMSNQACTNHDITPVITVLISRFAHRKNMAKAYKLFAIYGAFNALSRIFHSDDVVDANEIRAVYRNMNNTIAVADIMAHKSEMVKFDPTVAAPLKEKLRAELNKIGEFRELKHELIVELGKYKARIIHTDGRIKHTRADYSIYESDKKEKLFRLKQTLYNARRMKEKIAGKITHITARLDSLVKFEVERRVFIESLLN
jgi:hypothetical protein